jgi:hypothetical protein
MPLLSMLRDNKYHRLLELRGDELLYRKVTEGSSTEDDAVQFIKTSVDYIMTSKRVREETLRRKFMIDICRIIMVIETKMLRLQRLPYSSFLENTPTIATAIGDLAMLQRTVTKIEDLFDMPATPFPSALCTAAFCSDVICLEWQLTYLIRELKYKKKPEYSQ